MVGQGLKLILLDQFVDLQKFVRLTVLNIKQIFI